ncbi:MAG: hypothetical protein BWK80_09680 [Desulfobacteraceae bacterium IS3]|nr:MAG: hypothetical protein BWK80_09680 [Desulfobacteraceae bacterium IS3]
MKTVYIEIPKEIVLSLKIPSELVKKQVTEELAVHLYQRGFLSFGKARELANLSKWAFAERLGSMEIPRHYTKENLEEDIKFAYGE